MKVKQLIIGLVIAALAIYFTFRNVSLEELIASLATVHYIYLIPVVLLVLVSYIARVYRWQILLAPIKNLKPSQLYSPLMIGFMGNLLPARAGEVLRAYLLGKKQGITFTGAFATIVVERLFDTLMVLGMFSWLLMFHSDIFDSQAQWSGISIRELAFNFGLLAMSLVIILLAFVYLMLFQKTRFIVLVKWIAKPLPQRWHDEIEPLVEKFCEGLQVVRDINALIKITLYSVLVWAIIIASYYPLYWAYDLQNKSLESVVMLLVMICIFISAFPTPGFVGSFHAGVLIALHEIMHEAEITAVSLGMIAWALNMGIIVLGGVYFLLHEHLSVKELTHVKEEA